MNSPFKLLRRHANTLSEVCYFSGAVSSEEDISGLDITMNEVSLMQEEKPLQYLLGYIPYYHFT